MLVLFWIIGKGFILISLKVFNLGFFGDFEILLSLWNLLFLFIVVLIRTSVIIFSFSYMSGLWVSNFIFLYLSFVIRILWLILNNNFYWIIFGWDGLGVVSFLLIVFYINYERINNGLFTIFQNRIGDLFFVWFILGIIDIIIYTNLVLKWGLLFLILGSCVKRAQFPFNAWLLSAIRAPTPISSLVHSSTLVVAGVYILLQFNYCLVGILNILKYLRLFTLILRTMGLLFEVDIKKLIAYSTINHVALIMYIIRFGLFKIVYFHLNIHAMFKSLIFICFGFVILVSFHAQDYRLVSLNNLNPVIKVIYYLSCFCLGGLPFLRGFFSKDFIIEKLMENRIEFTFIFFLLVFLRVRIYYSIKLRILFRIHYTFSMVDKNLLAMFGLLVIGVIIVFIINLYISLVFRLTLEILSFKIRIYIFIFAFLFLSLIYNFSYKFIVFRKIIKFKETWRLDFYMLDKYMYWNMLLIIQYLGIIRNLKFFLLINWWVLVIVIVLF